MRTGWSPSSMIALSLLREIVDAQATAPRTASMSVFRTVYLVTSSGRLNGSNAYTPLKRKSPAVAAGPGRDRKPSRPRWRRQRLSFVNPARGRGAEVIVIDNLED